MGPNPKGLLTMNDFISVIATSIKTNYGQQGYYTFKTNAINLLISKLFKLYVQIIQSFYNQRDNVP